MDNEVMTRKEAAEFLRISQGSVAYLVKTDQIPYSRLGKRNVRFYRERLIEWMKERESVELRYEKP